MRTTNPRVITRYRPTEDKPIGALRMILTHLLAVAIAIALYRCHEARSTKATPAMHEPRVTLREPLQHINF